ncbi:MAG TPA: hypothetical protein VNK41_04540 [Vicinamibacterales bacterium]|nr:hypothetical protein [Vicinamibacterales bacterium]
MNGRRWMIVAALVVLGLGAAPPAAAQQRPLVTEDPETIGSGRMLVEGGIEYGRGMEIPVYGLEGNLWHLPSVGLSFGLGDVAELQVDSGFSRLSVTNRVDAPLSDVLDFTGDRTSAVRDIVVATKVRLLSEGARRPGIGVRFATKLPNASNETGLGTDMMDFAATLLIAKTVGSVRTVGNVGFAILGDPTELAAQHDPLVYSVSVARALTDAAEVVGELEGRWLPSESNAPAAENAATIRGGARYTFRTARLDAALIVGLTDVNAGFGFTAGVTWVFDAFRNP